MCFADTNKTSSLQIYLRHEFFVADPLKLFKVKAAFKYWPGESIRGSQETLCWRINEGRTTMIRIWWKADSHMLHGVCLFHRKKQDWWTDFYVLSLTKSAKGRRKERKEQTWCLSLFVHMFMSVYRCEGEVQLTCTLALVSQQRMSHDSDNTAEGTLQITEKETSQQNKNFQSFRSALCLCHTCHHPSDAQWSMLLLWHRNMKSVNYVAVGNGALLTIINYPLQRACTTVEHIFPPSCTSNDKYPPLHRLCEGYQVCLLKNHHV